MQPSTLYHYGKNLNSHDLIKIMAVILMIIDHVGEYLLNDNSIFRLLGRGAAPLFFFLIGYDNRLKLRPSLILYGLILCFTGAFLSNHFWMNILINFIFSYFLLLCYPPPSFSNLSKILLFIAIALLNGLMIRYIEYGLMGILWMYSARLCATDDSAGWIWLCATMIVYFIWENLTFGFFNQTTLLTLFSIYMLFLWGVMISYRFKPFFINSFLRIPGLILSRYSLEIYFYHLILLQISFFYLKYNSTTI